MFSKSIVTGGFFILTTLALFASCQHTKDTRREDSNVARATAQAGGRTYTEISFKNGSDELTDTSREKLRELTAEAARQGKKVDEIKILSWADVDYPAEGQKVSDKQVTLAKDRAKNIEKYMKDDLNAKGDIDTYNMAKRPYKLGEIFKTDDYEVKEIFERSGAAPTAGRMPSKKMSKAVIFVKYE
jgi:hypothetical protein